MAVGRVGLQRVTPIGDERCPTCGAAVGGGIQGCQALFDRLSVSILAAAGIAYTVRRLAVDCYCLQHPDRYCVSAKSLAAHLTGVCWAVEFGGGEHGLTALQSWLNGRVPLTKPPIPASYGRVTVADVVGRDDIGVAVNVWARSIWEAYAELHGVARGWVKAATGRG